MSRILSIGLIALAFAAMPMDDAFAAKKKKKGLGSRDQYTSEQRERIYKEALKICRKKYGPTSHATVNYPKGSILCYVGY